MVYRRLREHGLGDHCLELHSNTKADRKALFWPIEAIVGEARKLKRVTQWKVKLGERLQIRRDELNAYVAALHDRAPNGLTPYIAMGIATLEIRITRRR